jgi:trans-aconitate methyltransferase
MFNDAMRSSSSLFKDAIIENGDDIFKEIESVVDVGGGRGAMAQLIAENFPHVECTVLDLPHVVAEAPNGVVKFISGDMFNYIPPANAVLLKVRNNHSYT